MYKEEKSQNQFLELLQCLDEPKLVVSLKNSCL